QGADINAVSKDGLGVLHTTILLGQLEMARYFIAKEADIDLCSPDGQTPLSLAIMLGHDDLAEELIENNANCQIRNREGYSAYDIAIMLDNQKVVDSLIAHDMVDCNDDSTEPTTSNEQEMARFLILKGADVNLCDRNGITPLFMATSSSNFDMVYLLVLAGSNLKAKNGSKWSIAADQAKSLGHFGIHLFLVEDAPKIVKQLQRYQDECKRPDKNTYEIKKKRTYIKYMVLIL
ncbi:uncharacterized protein TRIADDRAFT_26699, partial [Trichoplax adhaerens]